MEFALLLFGFYQRWHELYIQLDVKFDIIWWKTSPKFNILIIAIPPHKLVDDTIFLSLSVMCQ